jgi:hypothetical protein
MPSVCSGKPSSHRLSLSASRLGRQYSTVASRLLGFATLVFAYAACGEKFLHTWRPAPRTDVLVPLGLAAAAAACWYGATFLAPRVREAADWELDDTAFQEGPALPTSLPASEPWYSEPGRNAVSLLRVLAVTDAVASINQLRGYGPHYVARNASTEGVTQNTAAWIVLGVGLVLIGVLAVTSAVRRRREGWSRLRRAFADESLTAVRAVLVRSERRSRVTEYQVEYHNGAETRRSGGAQATFFVFQTGEPGERGELRFRPRPHDDVLSITSSRVGVPGWLCRVPREPGGDPVFAEVFVSDDDRLLWGHTRSGPNEQFTAWTSRRHSFEHSAGRPPFDPRRRVRRIAPYAAIRLDRHVSTARATLLAGLALLPSLIGYPNTVVAWLTCTLAAILLLFTVAVDSVRYDRWKDVLNVRDDRVDFRRATAP